MDLKTAEVMLLGQGKETQKVVRFIEFVIQKDSSERLIREVLLQSWNSLACGVVQESNTMTSP